MKKITTLCLLLTFILCVVFTGCGNSDAGTANEDGNTKEQATTPPEESSDGEKETPNNEMSADQEPVEDQDPAEELAAMIPVIAQVPLEWEEPCIWARSAPDGTNAFEAWPGLLLIENENGWFTGRAPVWVNSIIISGNDGAVQTEDVSIEGFAVCRSYAW